MKQDLNDLLNKPVNRLDFLKHVGVGVAAIAGVGTIIETLNSLNGKKANQRSAVGYGGGAYGGSKESRSA